MLGRRGLRQLGEKLSYGTKTAFAILDFIVKRVVKIKNNSRYHNSSLVILAPSYTNFHDMLCSTHLLPYNFILRLIGLNVDIFNKSIASSKWIPVFVGMAY